MKNKKMQRTLFREGFHGLKKKRNYFEGWYLKQQNGQQTISLIPAFHITEKGERAASLQIITRDASYVLPYPEHQFYASKSGFHCQLGKSSFSKNDVQLDIRTEQLKLTGRLKFTNRKPIHSDIMGLFQYMPWLQCNHGILSMSHQVNGTLQLNEETFQFKDGVGYMEKDWGSSFPKKYFWTQCNWTAQSQNSIVLAIAAIPLGPISFTGCICSVLYKGKEYRLATYLGATIVKYAPKEILVKQGSYLLQVTILKKRTLPLQAPVAGSMSRTIKEGLACTVRYRFWHGSSLLFDFTSHQAGVE